MYRFFISSLVLLFSATLTAQNDSLPKNTNNKDSIVYKNDYGLRIGGDVSKLMRSFLDDSYKGFEVNADYRITQDFYIAGELGIEEKNTETDYYNVDSSGSYLKAGIDYNFYDNWFGMDNLMYAGLRVGIASFKHNLNSYTIYQTNHYWDAYSTNESQEFNNLSAIWTEFIVGFKVEVINNLYIGLNAQLKTLISETEPDNFENIYIPGFNKTYDKSSIGVGYGYTISYQIPLYKKNKK